MKAIDINCDMGEIPALVADGTQDALLKSVSSVNVSCGAHAGDPETIERTIRAARAAGVAVGAHPGYPDRANFGRIALAIPLDQVSDFVYQQLVEFEEIASRCETPVAHVKPHGALYNVAAREPATAKAVAAGIVRWRRGGIVMALLNSPTLDIFRESGIIIVGESFADRSYEPDGSLRNRNLPGALIHDPEDAAAQALDLANCGAQTICIHSDTKGSSFIAAAVARKLRESGWEITPYKS